MTTTNAASARLASSTAQLKKNVGKAVIACFPLNPLLLKKLQFNRLDTNKNGTLDRCEYTAGKTGVAKLKALAEFCAKDTNHDGKLSFAEYAGLPTPKFPPFKLPIPFPKIPLPFFTAR